MDSIQAYPVTLTKDSNGTILVDFPDFPEAHTFGDTKDEALARAVDALATVLDAYIADRRDIPRPSLRDRQTVVFLPALMASKVVLYELMRGRRVSKAELSRRLNWHLPQVDRLLDVHHSSQLNQLEQAFGALGQRLIVRTEASSTPASRRRETKRAGPQISRNARGVPARTRNDR